MEIETITQKLIAQADEELKRRIQESIKPIEDFLHDGCRHEIAFENEAGEKLLISHWTVSKALGDLVFELHHERNRQEKLAEFMAKVDRLSVEVDELKQSIG